MIIDNFLKTVIGAVLCLAVTVAHSQNTTTLTLSTGPGGQMTATALALQPLLSKWTDQNIVLDYKPGGNGMIAAREVSKSTQPEQFLLGMVQYVDFDLNQATEIVPVFEVGTLTLFLITGKQISSFKSVLDQPTKKTYSYGIVNGNSITKYVRGLFKTISDANSNIAFVEVPYKSAGQLMLDTAGGHVDFAVTALSAFKGVEGNKITPLLALGNARSEALPSVPTPQDLKIRFPEEDSIFRMFLWASPKTPAETVERIQKNYLNFLRSPDSTEFFTKLNFSAPSLSTATKPAATINKTLANDRK